MSRGPMHAAKLGLVIAAVAMASGAVRSQSGEQIAKAGNAAGAPACVTCHGPTGQGQAAGGFPRLAGLNAGYLARQLQSLRDATRTSPIMGPVAKLLSAADVQALAAYYAALPVLDSAVAPVASAAVLAAGEALAQRGQWSRGVPACAQCHGAKGLGVGVAFPQIAGQSAIYIANQLSAWQAGTRKNDPMGLMHGVASKLSATDVSAVAAYYASLSGQVDKPRSTKP